MGPVGCTSAGRLPKQVLQGVVPEQRGVVRSGELEGLWYGALLKVVLKTETWMKIVGQGLLHFTVHCDVTLVLCTMRESICVN